MWMQGMVWMWMVWMYIEDDVDVYALDGWLCM